jgi:hypothetical protein
VAVLFTVALVGSPGCVSRGTLTDYASDFTPGEGLGGCPNLAGTYVATGHAADYILMFPLPPIPVWWGRYPEQPRLDVDMGLLLNGNVAVEVKSVEQVVLAQPDANHLIITLLDDLGHAIEDFEEIVFTRGGREIERPENQTRGFFCSTSNALILGWGTRYSETGQTEMSIMLGRLLDGSLAVRTHAYMFSSAPFFVDQQWHRYERAPSRELSP